MGGFVESPPTEEIASCAHQTDTVRRRSGERRGSRPKRSACRTRTNASETLARRGSRLLQRRQTSRRTASRNHRWETALDRGAQARANFPRAALRQDHFRRAPEATDRSCTSPKRPRRYRRSICLLLAEPKTLRNRGEALLARLRALPLSARLVESKTEIGGGTLPRSVIRSVALEISSSDFSPNELAVRLRHCTPPH